VILDTSYKNPFGDYHANQIDIDSLIEYWCDPFQIFTKSGLSESEVYRDRGPLVFMGGRGSGKTMFLRQSSIEVQFARYNRLKDEVGTFADYLNNLGGVGIYIRFDGAILKSFEGCNLTVEIWKNLFIHYFELYVGREFLKAVCILEKSHSIQKEEELKVLNKELCELLGCDGQPTTKDIIDILTQRLLEVSEYRAVVGFQQVEFKPTKPFISQSLSFNVPELIKNRISSIEENTNFIILIDEYENFSPQQQEVVNTLLKFVTPGLTFRIGMRRNGWRTYATVNNDDFVKEGRDYRKYVFEDILHSKSSGYQDFLYEIARKRLERVPAFKERGNTDIRKFLNDKEDLEEEAINIVNGKEDRIDVFYKSKYPILKGVNLDKNKSPLLRVLGYLWILRGESEGDVNRGIYELENLEKKSRGNTANKLQYDLVNKYRLSLTIILSSIYRTHKSYYSFNTYSYLSSGIVGYFIELCRYAFRYAEFESSKDVIDTPIPVALQTMAAREVAFNELQKIKRIENYGGHLYRLAENLGSIFRRYHLDLKIRYPETNQFSLDESALEGNEKSVFDAALMWSVIQKKPRLQQYQPGSKRTEIYTLNRIFSPIFEISYRTRGGVSEVYDSDDFGRLISVEGVEPRRALNEDDVEMQRSIFD